MPTNIVLIDFENVQPESLGRFRDDSSRVLVFVGANQTKVPLELADSLQRLGKKAEYIKISGIGSNALDFHIAYYIGTIAVADPTAHFHIVSKDAGFDPLIKHLLSKKIHAARVKTVQDIRLPKPPAVKAIGEPLALAVAKLRQMNAARPRSVKTLSSTIAALFQKKFSDAQVSGVVKALADAGYVTIDGPIVSYNLPSSS